MPKMTGLEAFERIRQIAPQAKGLLITGFVREGTEPEELPEGLMGVLRKPFTLQQLSQCLRTALSGEIIENSSS